MAKKRSLVIEILGNNKMGRAVRDAMGSLKKLGRFAKGVGRGIFKAFKFAAAGIGVMVGAVAAATAIFAKQQQADVDLAASIRKHGEEVDRILPKLKAQASAIQAETKYGDEFIETLQAQAMNMGILSDGASEAVRSALGLAKAYGIEVVGAMRLVTRARVGDTASLKRYGIMIDSTLTAEEKYQAILKIGLKNYRLVQDEVNSVSGRFAQFKNAIGDVIESFGGAFAEGINLQGVLETMTTKAEVFGTELKTRLLPYMEKFRDIVEGLLSGGGDRAKAIDDIKATWSKAIDIVGPKLEQWGEAAGAAIWRGFKKRGKSALTAPYRKSKAVHDAGMKAEYAMAPRGGPEASAGYLPALTSQDVSKSRRSLSSLQTQDSLNINPLSMWRQMNAEAASLGGLGKHLGQPQHVIVDNDVLDGGLKK